MREYLLERMLFISPAEFRDLGEFITNISEETAQKCDEMKWNETCSRTETQRLNCLNTWRLLVIIALHLSHVSNVSVVLQGLVLMFLLQTWALERGRCPGSQTLLPPPWDTMWVSTLNINLNLRYAGGMETDEECQNIKNKQAEETLIRKVTR